MKSVNKHVVAATICLGLAAAAVPAAAVSLGQVDTFEDGTTEGWHDGGSSPIPPTVIGSGGPAGSDDPYLQLTALGGSGPGSRLVVIGGSSWTGDFLAAGVTAIELDAINQGDTDLQLRLYFNGAAGSTLSSAALTLPAAGDWTHLLFPILPAALTGPDPAAVLASVNELRLFHNPDPSFPPPPTVGTLGIDNVVAAAVPEPATLWLWAAGAVLLPVLRRKALLPGRTAGLRAEGSRG